MLATFMEFLWRTGRPEKVFSVANLPCINSIDTKLKYYTVAREDKGVRKLIPHIGPIAIVIPLKLF